jgi:hypothetical protein
MRISCHDLGYSEHAAFELQFLVSDVCQKLEEQTNQIQLMVGLVLSQVAGSETEVKITDFGYAKKILHLIP